MIGSSGSGKTTISVRLAAALDLPCIELDAINWQADWRDLDTYDRPEFIRRVEAAVAGDSWVCDGNYSTVANLVWRRATHLVWLDYNPSVFMPRVIGRSLMRAFDRRELWNGNRERWQDWLNHEHPILWAWRTWRDQRERYEALLDADVWAHLKVIRLRHPDETTTTVEALRGGRALYPNAVGPAAMR